MKLESDTRSNSYLRKELKCDINMYADHELSSEITIKNEPYSSENTTEVKLELEEPSVSNAHSKNGFIFVSLDSVTEFNNDCNNVKMGNRNFKKEPYWLNTVSDMINASERSVVSNADLEEENEGIASDVNKGLQESFTEASRSQSERICSFGTAMSTFSASADVERNICLEMKEDNGETDLVLGSKTDSAVHGSHTHEIKDVPLYLDETSTKIKLEIEEPSVINTHLMKQLGPDSSNCASESENNAVICKADNAVHMKIEIKEETWLDTSCEVPLDSRVSLGIETDLQSYEKNCTSDREEKYQELLQAQKPRLHTETVCPSVSAFSINEGCIKMKEHNPGCEETGNECKEKWKHLRECYRKAIICRERSGTKGGKLKEPWKYEKELRFLKTSMPTATPQTSNVQAKRTEMLQIAESEPNDSGSSDANFDQSTPTSTTVFSNSRKRKVPKESVASVLKEYSEKSDPLASTYPQADAITTLFLSMAATVKSFPPDLQILTKKRVMEVVTDCEIEALNRQNLNLSESGPSIEVPVIQSVFENYIAPK